MSAASAASVPGATRRRRRIAALATALAAVLVAAPGVHLFERWLPPLPAIVVSHALALLGLALAAYRWRRA